MSNENDDFYEGTCGYFEGQKNLEEMTLIPDESELLNLFHTDGDRFRSNFKCSAQEFVYGGLLESGWRRSGNIFYRENCPQCKKCLGIRLYVDRFTPSKSQRKSVRKNADLELTLSSVPEDLVTDEKVQLMKKYDRRHKKGTDESDEDVRYSLLWLNGIKNGKKQYSGTFNMDYRLNGKLIAVGVVDKGEGALSSNYFYYDISDDSLKRSLGVFSVIQEIEACRGNLFDGALKSDLYYLGYYIADCKKMNYKIQYRPNQLLIDGVWTDSEKLEDSIDEMR